MSKYTLFIYRQMEIEAESEEAARQKFRESLDYVDIQCFEEPPEEVEDTAHESLRKAQDSTNILSCEDYGDD